MRNSHNCRELLSGCPNEILFKPNSVVIVMKTLFNCKLTIQKTNVFFKVFIIHNSIKCESLLYGVGLKVFLDCIMYVAYVISILIFHLFNRLTRETESNRDYAIYIYQGLNIS